MTTLLDAGPMLAIIDPRQGEIHRRCIAALTSLCGNLLTTWPCIGEAMHLADNFGGHAMQQNLWRLLAPQVFNIFELRKAHAPRMNELMERYRNVPMDFGDASLVVAAEESGCQRVFTLDNDFRIYRPGNDGIFEVIPE